jgi:uncharacterized membrane protein YfcA
MGINEALLLIGSGILAGAINSVAGGGTFFTFPALIFAGVSPLSANATSTIAVWPGAVASAWAYRKQLSHSFETIWKLGLVSLIGGGLGAGILLLTPEQIFEALIPWLMLMATLLFAFGDHLRRFTSQEKAELNSAKSLFSQWIIALYGGYFGAGIGILMLALLKFLGLEDIHQMNALKTVLGSAINGVAVIVFLFSGMVDWAAAVIMIIAAIAGGYWGAIIAQKLPKIWVKRAVIFTGFFMTIWFFVN